MNLLWHDWLFIIAFPVLWWAGYRVVYAALRAVTRLMLGAPVSRGNTHERE